MGNRTFWTAARPANIDIAFVHRSRGGWVWWCGWGLQILYCVDLAGKCSWREVHWSYRLLVGVGRRSSARTHNHYSTRVLVQRQNQGGQGGHDTPNKWNFLTPLNQSALDQCSIDWLLQCASLVADAFAERQTQLLHGIGNVMYCNAPTMITGHVLDIGAGCLGPNVSAGVLTTIDVQGHQI